MALRYLFKKMLLKNFAKFAEKQLCWSLFLNKVTVRRPANLLKKETPAQVFPYEFCEIFKNTYFVEHLHTFITMFGLSFFE